MSYLSRQFCQMFSLGVLVLRIGRIGTLAAALLVSGCSTLSSLDHITMGKSSREAELQLAVDHFCKAYYWGSTGELAQYVEDGAWRDFATKFNQHRKGERLVDLQVENVDFDDNSRSAQVDIKVRYFKEPTYLVQQRVDKQTWNFHRLDGGWRFHKLDIGQDESIEQSEPHTASLKNEAELRP